MRTQGKSLPTDAAAAPVDKPPYKVGQLSAAAASYRNARRGGITHPEMVEIITSDDAKGRHHSQRPRGAANRALARALGYSGTADDSRTVRGPKVPAPTMPAGAGGVRFYPVTGQQPKAAAAARDR